MRWSLDLGTVAASLRRYGSKLWAQDRALLMLLALIATMVTASYVSKLPCSGAPYDAYGYSANLGPNSYRLLCLTDIQALWYGRGIDQHQFPYVHGQLEPGNGPPGVLVDGALEYPVLTGLFMWFTGLPSSDSGDYLAWNFLLLLPVALAIGWQLHRLVGWRALIWAAAPAMVFYSVYNWDLLPIVWTLGAVLAWRRQRYALAAVCLGLGAAVKIYPGFFLLPLVIERLVAKDRRGALVVAGAGGGAWLVVNLPFMLANLQGWWATYAFQADRVADLSTNSIYFWGFPTWSAEAVDRFSIVAIGLSWVAAVVLGYVWRPEPLRYPWLAVTTAMLCTFLAFNKVYSPQYVMWVLPLLCLIRVRWGWWVAYWCIDATLFIGLMRWYYDMNNPLAHQAAIIGGWGKTVLLLLLSVAVLRAPLAFDTQVPAVPVPARAGDLRDSRRGRRSLARVR